MKKTKRKKNLKMLNLKFKKQLNQINSRNLSMQWVEVMPCKEKKRDKMSVNLRLTRQHKKKKIHKNLKLTKFLKNVKTIKTRLELW